MFTSTGLYDIFLLNLVCYWGLVTPSPATLLFASILVFFVCFRCRKTQAQFDKCVLEKLGWERPPLGYYARIRLHDTGELREKCVIMIGRSISTELITHVFDNVSNDNRVLHTWM